MSAETCSNDAVLLLEFDARVLDDLAPLGLLGLDKGGELLGRAAHRLRALGLEILFHALREQAAGYFAL